MTQNRDRIEQLIDDVISTNRSKGPDVVREALIDAIDKNFEIKLAHTVAIELFAIILDAHTVGKVTDPGRYTVTVNADGTVSDGEFEPLSDQGGPAPVTDQGQAAALTGLASTVTGPGSSVAGGTTAANTGTAQAAPVGIPVDQDKAGKADDGFADGSKATTDAKSPATGFEA